MSVRGRRNLAIAGLVVLGTLAVFAPALRHGFVNYDDPEYVTENPRVRAGLSWAGLGWAFAAPHAANWHPLTWLSHMLDAQLFGLAPAGHHASSVLLHAASAALLFGVLEGTTGAPWPSAFVAATFALHPLRVESVAWVSERKDVLAGLCWMLALAAYRRYVRRRGAAAYLLVVAAFVLGLLARPTVVTLPLILLLLDVWPLRRPWNARLLWEKAPLLLLSAAVSALTVVAQRGAGAMASLESLPLGTRIAEALVAYGSYLEKTFWPTRLAVFYPHRPLPVAEVAVCALLLAGVSALALVERRRRPYLLVGWLWYLVALLPVVGLVKVGEQAMADRFSYLPQIGVLLMIAWAAADAGGSRAVASAGGVVALAACVALTARQLDIWRDSVSLFAHASAVSRDNYVAEANLGAALLEQGRRAEALVHLRRSAAIKPGYAKVHVSLGKALAEGGDPEAALREYTDAIRLDGDSATAHYNLGLLLAGQARLDEAIAEYRAALRIDPEYAKARHNLGAALATQGRFEDAIEQYRQALALVPDRGVTHGNLAIALERLGRSAEAVAEYREAVRLMPADPTAHFNLAGGLAGAGRVDEAIAELRQALRLRPDWPEGRAALAEVEGRRREAVRRGP